MNNQRFDEFMDKAMAYGVVILVWLLIVIVITASVYFWVKINMR
jgi:hypothetical protein